MLCNTNARMMNLFAIAFLAADNGGGNGGTVETVNTEATTETKVERAEAVDDAVIIQAYLETAEMKDKDGKVIGTMDDAAELAGMKRGSFNGRIQSLKKLLGEDAFPKLARSASTGKTRKKNVADVLAILNKIKGEIGKPADKTDSVDANATDETATDEENYENYGDGDLADESTEG